MQDQFSLLDPPKRCSGCNQVKPFSEFWNKKASKDGKQGTCIECIKPKTKTYYEANRERILQHAKSQQDPQKKAEYDRVYRDKNRDWINQRNKQYRIDNPDFIRRMTRTLASERRARKAATQVEKVDLAAVWRRDEGRCHICGKYVKERVDFDHVIPLSRGGTHTYDNIKVSHHTCNRRKHTKLMEEIK